MFVYAEKVQGVKKVIYIDKTRQNKVIPLEG